MASDDTTAGAQPPPPGWYPDPTDKTQQRYWDGGSWTKHTGRDSISMVQSDPHLENRGIPVSTWERASFVVTYLLGGLLLGPVAMRYAGRAGGALAAGDRTRARGYATRAKVWTVVAFIAGLATIAVVLWALDLLPAEISDRLP